MCDETRDFPIPVGGGKKTLGDLFDRTPKDLISMVMLEEKVFETCYSGKTVLLGDACHKLHPSGGRGAVTVMHDAIALANLLYVLPSNTSEDITSMFEEYRSERYPIVLDVFKSSQMLSKVIDKGLTWMFTRFMLRNTPAILRRTMLAKTVKARPQLRYAEPVEVKGSVAPFVSPSSEKAKAAYERRKRSVAV